MAEAFDLKQDLKYVGTRPVRPDGVDKVTGRAQYGADHNLPNMIYGKVLRSPHAHARITAIDTSAAEALPGVLAVVTGADFPTAASGEIGGESGGDVADVAKNVMARDKVLYHGHAVAAVAAKSTAIAEQALALIVVDYEPLTPVMSIDQAIANGAPILDEQCFTKGLPEQPSEPSNIAMTMTMPRGEIEEGFAAADVIVEGEFNVPMAHQGYIEPHACTANTNESGEVTVWCCTQAPFEFRNMTAKILGKRVGDIKVVSTEIGGGFGGKTVVYLEPLAALLSQKSRRPVKMTMSREEVFRATGPTSGTKIKARLGAKNDGTFVAAEATLWYEAGAFAGAPVGPGCMSMLAPYQIPNFKLTGYDVRVNKPKVAAYRAPGAPQSMHAFECLVDELAQKLDVDPIDLRLHNVAEEGTQAPYGPKFGPIGMRACLEAAKAHPNYTKPLDAGVGRGVSAAFWFNIGGESSAEVHVNEDGTVTILEGNPDIGGSRASMCLMAAETLGVEYDNVKALITDTQTGGYTMVTGGSRTTFATGMAVVKACEDVIAQCRARAAATWELDIDQVAWEDGHAVPAPGVNADVAPLSLKEIAGNTARTGGPLLGRASLNAAGAGPSFAVNIAELRADRETGSLEVLSFTGFQDAGKAIHPDYVEGQIQGGAVQGIGWALNEEYIYGEDGVMQNAGFLDYRIPVASDLPMIDAVIIEVPNPNHPYGVRGVGETGIVGPLAAMANAASRALGFRVNDLPLSPPRVLEAIEAHD
ncbi:MAG: xanthine dehydrogenase family protein molybdopterin-binding subunit [Pseudomonadota bacterium]